MSIDEIVPVPVDGGPTRRTVLAGAVGTLAAVGLGSAAAAGATIPTRSPGGGRSFDAALAAKLQKVLHDALRDPDLPAPGAILHVQSPTLGSWSGAAGLGRVRPKQTMATGDRFRAGSILKPFIATVVLQLAERNRLSLDTTLPQVLPPDVTARFPDSADITVRMLLGHRSGLPEWDTELIDIVIGHHPGKVWTIAEKLDLAAAQPQVFLPGTDYSYCNTEYNLLGLIIEHTTGRPWRNEVTRRIIAPFGLSNTYLPRPGQSYISGPHVHGYGQQDGGRVDWTGVDPSMAGAAGGGALVTTAHDLANFIDALLAGRPFRRPGTLKQMLTFAPAPGEGGQVGYGLGVEQRVAPGDVELIGHIGGTAGYLSYAGRLQPQGVTMTFVLNELCDPTPLFLPTIEALVAAHK